MDGGTWWAAVHGVAKSQTRLSSFTFTFHFHALEKEMATHSSVLAWRIPGTGDPGGLPSVGVTQSWTGLKWLSSSSSSSRQTIYSLNGILHSNRKQQTIDTYSDGSQGYQVEWKKPISEGYTLYNSICWLFFLSFLFLPPSLPLPFLSPVLPFSTQGLNVACRIFGRGLWDLVRWWGTPLQ